ncbi:MAG: biotin/lipoyl-containing protein [Bacteroidales bacterium]|jgi:biotin carboxyl carrier protein|nr:biotin/lipoyl-containing protein [Bacteroidales bacterium]
MKDYKFIINGVQYEVEILSLENGKARIEVNGTLYNIDILADIKQVKTPTIVRPLVKEPQKEIEKKPAGPKTEIRSPLPGIIVNIFVKSGDEVKKGQTLFSLEAMKMENEIKAERDGVIVKVNVAPGQSVLQEEVVMEMD